VRILARGARFTRVPWVLVASTSVSLTTTIRAGVREVRVIGSLLAHRLEQETGAAADPALVKKLAVELYLAEYDWGVFLKAVRRLDPENTAYLKALVERKDLWDPVYGNAHNVFRDAGLPYDRKACARLVGRRWLRR